MKKQKLFFFSILSVFAFYLGNRATGIYLSLTGNIVDKLSETIDKLGSIQENIFYIETSIQSLIVGGSTLAAVWLIYLYKAFDTTKYMPGKEHGSAEWGTIDDIKPFIDANVDNNIILTSTESLTMESRPKIPKNARNKNVLVIGGSGSGKTRFYVKPNLMQMHSSYIITDPKGNILNDCGKMLADNGYTIRVFNLKQMDKSDKYNPLIYIKDEKDILSLINNIIINTNDKKNKSSGDFWEKAERALLQALVAYVYYEAPNEEKNLNTVMELLRLAEVREDNEDFKSPLDILFEELKERDPNHFACKQYDLFKLAAGKTAKSILVSVGVRLSPFYINSVSDLISDDTLYLDTVGSEKTALFVIIPDEDTTFNFLAAIMYQQMFNVLIHRADTEYGGRLPFHVRCLLDEFANIGQIPNFEIYIATIRSREISVSVVLQNLAQIKSMYKDSWETITGNCDTLLFLGGKEQSTQEYLSKMLGKTTINHKTYNETKGQNGSYSVNNQILARDLQTADEIDKLDGEECILSIRGLKPFKSKKYNIERHKRYKLLADYQKQNIFDINERDTYEIKNFFKDVKQVKHYDLSNLDTL